MYFHSFKTSVPGWKFKVQITLWDRVIPSVAPGFPLCIQQTGHKPRILKEGEKQALAMSHVSMLGPTPIVAPLQNSPLIHKCSAHELGKAFVGLQLPLKGLLPKTPAPLTVQCNVGLM